MKALLLTLALSIVPFVASADSQTNYEFNYENQAGSKLMFNMDKDGKLNGAYISALGCAKGASYPLTGWANDKAISFSVNFGECNSITSWAGHKKQDGTINTLWSLSRSNSANWDALLTGSSQFKPVTK